MADIKPFVCVRPAEDVVSAVAALPYRKTSNKKNNTQNKRKSNPVVKKSSKTKKQQERARKYFMFKMNQLRE